MVSGYRITQDDLSARRVEAESKAVAAAEEDVVFVEALQLQGEGRGVDAVGRVQRRGEAREDVVGANGEEAQERGLLAAAVERGEAAQELGIGDEAGPALADEGGAGEGGRPRREAEEDLTEEVVVVRQGRRQRGGAAAAAHQTLTHLE